MSDDRETILVIGPTCSGVTSVADRLGERFRAYQVVEQLSPGEHPAAVVFVVSAAAPMNESDARLLAAAAVHTDAVVAAVSKIDVHRRWPWTLEINRALLTGYADRYTRLAWVGVAADPHIGQVRVDKLAEEVRAVLARQVDSPRNPLRPREFQARPRSVRSLVVRSKVQQSRVHISGQVRAMCTALRTDLRNDAAEVTRREVDEFCSRVHRRAADVAAEVDASLTGQLADLADGIELSAPPCPPLESYLPRFFRPRLENRLSNLLSAGFGLGAALTLGRLLADFAPSRAPTVIAGALVAGIALTVWVIRTRRLLAERAALDRWVTEVTAGLRAAVEERALIRLVAVESALAAVAARGEFPDLRRFANPARGDRT